MKSFSAADVVVLPEIYDVAGREEVGMQISSDDLAKAMKAFDPKKQIYFTGDLDNTVVEVKKLIKDEDVVIVMGAGDVYNIVGVLRATPAG